jgi:predicted ATPase with chaperone activity
MEKLGVSAPAYHHILKSPHAIADLAGNEEILPDSLNRDNRAA